jgi:methylthioxylose transferase
MSKAEVERIWLPFVPWVLLAASALPASRRRRWLFANVALALVLELAVVQPW